MESGKGKWRRIGLHEEAEEEDGGRGERVLLGVARLRTIGLLRRLARAGGATPGLELVVCLGAGAPPTRDLICRWLGLARFGPKALICRLACLACLACLAANSSKLSRILMLA